MSLVKYSNKTFCPVLWLGKVLIRCPQESVLLLWSQHCTTEDLQIDDKLYYFSWCGNSFCSSQRHTVICLSSVFPWQIYKRFFAAN